MARDDNWRRREQEEKKKEEGGRGCEDAVDVPLLH